MTIYLENVFIENLIMDFIILKETNEIAKLNVNIKRVILACLFSSIYMVLMFLFKLEILNYAVSKILLAMCTVYIGIKIDRVKTYFKCILLFFLVSVINVGTYLFIQNIFNIQNNTGFERALIYISTYYLAKLFIKSLWKIYRSEINKKELNYIVEINIKGRLYTYEGFLDTGNTVYSHGMPIIFTEILDESMLDDLKEIENFNVKTVTLGNVCTKKAYILEGIKIKSKKQTFSVKAGVVFENRKFSKENNYNMILNYILYTEIMGGIEI